MKKQRTVMALLAGALIFTLFSVVPVHAELYKFSIGAGLGLAPQYEGSDDYEGIPVLFAEGVWDSGRYVKLEGTTLRANVLANGMFMLGPVANFRLGRDDSVDVDDRMVKRMQKIDDSFELGAFGGLQIDNWTFMLMGLSDVSDGHDGFVATLSSRYTWRVNDPWIIKGGVSTSWADSEYMSSFFGVNTKDSNRSGLKRYNTDDGFKDVGCNLAATYIWTDNLSINASGIYKRLVGDAKDSPVVDDRGDASQYFFTVKAIYTF